MFKLLLGAALGAAALTVPSVLMVVIKRLTEKNKGTLRRNIYALVTAFIATNWSVCIWMIYHSYIKKEPVRELLLSPRLALRYMAIALVIAAALPLAEHLVKYLICTRLRGFYRRTGIEWETPTKDRRPLRFVLRVLGHTAVLVLLLLTFAVPWTDAVFYYIKFGEVVATLSMPLDGSAGGLVYSFVNRVVVPALFVFALVLYVTVGAAGKYRVVLRRKKNGAQSGKAIRLFPAGAVLAVPLLAVWSVVLFNAADKALDIRGYIDDMSHSSAFIEEEYVSPRDVKLTFPEKKRNLIYIYLESAESSTQDKASGGLFDINYTPELTKLAEENISFSESDLITGAQTVDGSTFTMGAITSHSAGLPLKLGNYMERYAYFMPNVVTLGDILEDAGYHNYFMCGSELGFAGRDKYYLQHGAYECFDYTSAIEEGKIPEDYKVWWGFEDEKLYQFAKEKLTMLAASDRPFNFTMLTVDTHNPDGYICRLCEEKYDQKYLNVCACASRQVYDFVGWIMQQDFYENTTVIICGDHLSMSSSNFKTVKSSQRRVYNCFINCPLSPVSEKNRQFSTLDLFPSTLSALGVEIEGSRLGLGVDLFSGEPTLMERYGTQYMRKQMSMRSEFYEKHILK